eukprot:5897624-Pleurochrysis_carterae.AAC.1
MRRIPSSPNHPPASARQSSPTCSFDGVSYPNRSPASVALYGMQLTETRLRDTNCPILPRQPENVQNTHENRHSFWYFALCMNRLPHPLTLSFKLGVPIRASCSPPSRKQSWGPDSPGKAVSVTLAYGPNVETGYKVPFRPSLHERMPPFPILHPHTLPLTCSLAQATSVAVICPHRSFASSLIRMPAVQQSSKGLGIVQRIVDPCVKKETYFAQSMRPHA